MRYALFYTTPPSHDLTRIAARWLGRDAYSGARFPHTAHGTLSAKVLEELTRAPRRYGFHATLKAPFELSKGSSLSRLMTFMETFCENRQTFTMPRLKVDRLGPFFALVPDGDAQELNRFAAETVQEFDGFRAPLSETDYQRRKPDSLTEQQRAYLRQWGYPYIFEAFRFHMTLTGPVPDAMASEVETHLRTLFDPYLRDPQILDHLTLFREEERGAPFCIHASVPLAPQSVGKADTL
jgi:putative phosphonate metabolism protein